MPDLFDGRSVPLLDQIAAAERACEELRQSPIVVPLRCGDDLIIDQSALWLLGYYQWHLSSPKLHSRTRYMRCKWNGKTLHFHREVLGLTDPRVIGDHINGNGLDNRRFNLREVTRAQNNHNIARSSISWTRSCGYVGVSFHKTSGLFHAKVGRGRSSYHKTAYEAAVARDVIATEIYGEFAFLNFPTSTVESRQAAHLAAMVAIVETLKGIAS